MNDELLREEIIVRLIVKANMNKARRLLSEPGDRPLRLDDVKKLLTNKE